METKGNNKRIALVTGANQGVGFQVAKELVAHVNTDFQLPTTDYQLPTTDYQLPTTNYRLLPHLSFLPNNLHLMFCLPWKIVGGFMGFG